ncbi:hypothetical protein [Granulosicoccus antarcticus]|uniref:Uncharacterized protein n=1 Tax=Granulosicoccus antarcticus IMCC3135 TaxID=1192854 RepID=A0A2Z2NPS0_9GAMM|nr:hypothetical protein [Granulosicoccus antarcticus]ASJ73269.1 hypothetical protein IMCC3135_15935 [Granulosicoccus antarcticus IMCC3135]
MSHCCPRVPAFLPVICTAFIFLAGCGSSSDSPSTAVVPSDDLPTVGSPNIPDTSGGDNVPPGNTTDAGSGALLTYVGYIALVQTTPANSLFDGAPLRGASPNARASAVLTRLNEPFSLTEYREARALDEDQCTRYVDYVAVEGRLEGATDSLPSDLVDGGEVLTIQSPQGSYAELLVNPNSVGTTYANVELDSLPLPVPDGLIANIPGGEFPAVADIVIPNVDLLVVLGDSPEGIHSSEFRWEAGSDPSSIVMLSIIASSLDGSSNGVLCTAIDDGEFVVPDWAAENLIGNHTTIVRTMQREVYALTVEGDTLVVGSNLSPYSSL